MLYRVFEEGCGVNAVLRIAEKEFSDLVRSPLVVIVFVILCALMVINGAGCPVVLPMVSGLGNTYYTTSLYFTFASMCLGVMSIAGERSNGAMRALLSKPVYRRDVVAGKFLGMSALLLAMIIPVMLLDVSSIMVAYGGPVSLVDVVARMGSYAIVLLFNCMLTVGITMLFGILLKDLIEALALSISYLYLGWFAGTQYMNYLDLINPIGVYHKIIFGNCCDTYLFSDVVTYSQWLGGAAPYIALILVEIAFVFLTDCMLFNYEET